MSEEQTNTETQETNEQTIDPVDKVRASMSKQITEERNARIALETQIAERNAADELQQREAAEKKEEWKTLFESTEAKLAEQAASHAALLAEQQEERSNLAKQNLLLKAGITDEEKAEFMIYKFNKLEDAGDFSEWLAAQDVQPTAPVGKPSGTIGTVAQKANEPFVMPTSYAETANWTKEQKAAARQAIREQARRDLG